MTSQRKLKKRAEALGMTRVELKLVELLEEVLTDMRWMQILAYSNQYLLNEKLQVTQDERDQILEAATRAVDRDAKFPAWRERLGRLKSEIGHMRRSVGAERSDGDGDGDEEGPAFAGEEAEGDDVETQLAPEPSEERGVEGPAVIPGPPTEQPAERRADVEGELEEGEQAADAQ